MAASLDRFREAHFWIHTLEQFYHYADPFRWHLNAFLKAIKEVPQLLSMDLQNEKGFSRWFRGEKEKLFENPLLSSLFKKRDLIVHRGMLIPSSHGGIGITEGRGFKVGFSLPINPMMNSDEAMHRYLFTLSVNRKDPLDVLRSDEESAPCVYRIWKMTDFDDEVVDLAAKAWLQVGDAVGDVVKWFGLVPPELDLSCRHSGQNVQFKLYDRKALRKTLKAMRKALKEDPRTETGRKLFSEDGSSALAADLNPENPLPASNKRE
jgi:hypothetical protein